MAELRFAISFPFHINVRVLMFYESARTYLSSQATRLLSMQVREDLHIRLYFSWPGAA